jgi:putative glutamine amidotransferase
MDSPVIGLSSYLEQARWTAWDEPAVLVPEAYVRAVANGGALPVVLPAIYPVAAQASRVLERLDGLVLIGGPDVDPAHYGHESHARTSPPRRERDAVELALLDAALATGLPVLCVCRGLQLLNVARGGTLEQHLPDVAGHTGHAPEPGTFGRHEVIVEPGSMLAQALGRTRAEVATSHHQAIATLGNGLVVSARALDGTTEAVEDSDHAGLLAVQWHPEAGTDLALMRWLTDRASHRAGRAERAGRAGEGRG